MIDVQLHAGQLMDRSGYWFTCQTCGRRSGLFSMKDARDIAAKQHPTRRCPGAPVTR